MKNHPHIYALVLMLVVCTNSIAQNKINLSKDNTPSKIADSLTGPKIITRNVIQDKKGNIWIAAFDGIFKYDGKSFTNIIAKVSSARFFSVLEDSKGKLWFGAIGAGVYSFDGKSFQHYTTKDGLAADGVICIYEDKAGNIWFATGGGASRYDGKSFQTFKMAGAVPVAQPDSLHSSIYQSPLPENSAMHNDVNAIIEDKAGKLWFGTRGYAFIYNGKTFTKVTNTNGKPFANVRSIIKDKKGNIWLGGYDGLWRYDGNTFTSFNQKFVGHIMEDKKGNIWTSAESANGKGWVLSRYDAQSLAHENPTATEIVNKPMIFGIKEANDGSIWFGALDGVYRFDGKIITDFKSKGTQK